MKFLSLVGLYLASASFALACSFGPDADIFKTPEENKDSYPIVFVGEIVSVLETEDITREYTFRVDTSYKGDLESEVIRVSPGHSCGFFGDVGQVGLFFLDDESNEIAEWHPKYFYRTLDEAIDAAEKVFGEEVEPAEQVEVCLVFQAPDCFSDLECYNNSTTLNNTAKTFFGTKRLEEDTFAKLLHEGECKVSEEILEFRLSIPFQGTISSPFIFKGVTNNNGDWLAFEGQIGVATLYDENDQELDWAPLSVVGEWMKEGPHEFTGSFNFKTNLDSGYVVIRNEDPSGQGKKIELNIPLKFLKASPEDNFVGPVAGPLENFVAPTTPPPSLEIDAEIVEKKAGFWSKISNWFKGLWAWFF